MNQPIEPAYPLEAWKQHALIELGGIFAGIFEYEKPGDIAARLRAIAKELDECYSPADEVK